MEDGDVITRPSVVDMICSVEGWLQNDLDSKKFGSSTALQ